MSEPTQAVRDARKELLARLLAEEGLAAPEAAIARRIAGSETPLSHAQEVVWLLDRATPDLTAYNSVLAYRLQGTVDVAALEHAFHQLVARHEALRTRFAVEGDQPRQVVDADGTGDLRVIDVRGLPAGEREAAATHHLEAGARERFDLERDHLLRPILVLLSDTESQLMLVAHHIICDAWSYGVMVRELSLLYNAGRTGNDAGLAEPALQFADFAAWERRELQGDRLQQRLAYWRENLLPPAPELAVPTDRPRAGLPTFTGDETTRLLSRSVLERVKALAAAEGATLYMVLLAAYQAVLHRWSGQDDVVTGSAIAGRTRSETEGVIGYFSGALPLRTRFVRSESFRALLGRVRITVLGALEHQDVPIEALVRDLQDHGRSSQSALFQAVLTMQETIGVALDLAHVSATRLAVATAATKFDLTLLPTEREDGLELLLWYRTDLYDRATAERFLRHVETLLVAAVAEPAREVATISLLSGDEVEELRRWNATAQDFGAATTMSALTAAAARRAPHAAAVVAGDVTLTWEELESRASRLAHALQRRGAGPDVVVGLTADRSADLIVGMLGILWSGAAYVPLLPDIPLARFRQQLESSGAKLMVTVSAYRERSPAGLAMICLDAADEELANFPDKPPLCGAAPASLAYILFTSGSTGVPKGVGVTHAALVNYARAIAARLGLELDGSAVEAPWHGATVSTLAADLGHTSVFPILVSGGVLHVIPAEVGMDATRFQQYVLEHPLDLLKITPSHFQALAPVDMPAAFLPRKWLVLGGEPCPWSLAGSVAARGACRVLNHYGPTETTVGATTFEVGSVDVAPWAPATVPIGRPLANVTAHVLDANDALVPVGVVGELWIGGAGVARGYLGRDDLTADRFVIRQGERCYRTGDRARRLPTGDLEFLGRLDGQVKVRGHRVELGEIEAALQRHASVRQAVVVQRDDATIAYVVESAAVPDDALATHLGQSLPDYMLPSIWMRVERLPLTANGKVDRAALPAPIAAGAAAQGETDAPRGMAEQKLATIWGEVLKREYIGRNENFFALGGHSLLAIRLLGKISRQFGVRLPLRTLFEHPTIAALAPVVAPAHPLEAPLAAVWAEILKRPTVDVDENFFSLGGHSLLAIRLLGRISKQFGVRLALRTLFEHPTVAQLAPVISAAVAAPGE